MKKRPGHLVTGSTEPKRQFRADVTALVPVFLGSLYTSEADGVREQLQNGNDAIVRRTIEAPDPPFTPRIDVLLRRKERLLIIKDNGMGLTAEEAEDYLSTIGRSYTRELRDRLGHVGDAAGDRLVGQFGLGFLSAFLLGSEVEVVSRSCRPGAAAIRWFSGRDGFYTLEAAQRPEPGTTVTIRLAADCRFLADPKALEAIVRSFARFLAAPIWMEGATQPVNGRERPWRCPDAQRACALYARDELGVGDTLWLSLLEGCHVEGSWVPLEGFVFVPSSSFPSLEEHGEASVYVRGMLICEHDKRLLPPWARFARAVVECPILQPTASREAIHEDDAHQLVRRALEQQLATGLRRLANDAPSTWRQLVRSHWPLMVTWAVESDEFFDLIADVMVVTTSIGQIPLSEYLERTGGKIHYVARTLDSLRDQVLAFGSGVPVITAKFGMPEFLEKYAQCRWGVSTVRVDEVVLCPSPDDGFEDLLAAVRRHAPTAVRVSEFAPEELFAVLELPANIDLVHEADLAIDSGVSDATARLLRAQVQHLLERDGAEATLWLNASSPVIQRLAVRARAGELRGEIVALLVEPARFFSPRGLTAAGAVAAFGRLSAAILELCR